MMTARRKIMMCLAALLLAFIGCAPVFNSTGAYALGADSVSFDTVNVLDDLQSSTVNGQPFNLDAYPRNPYGTAAVITFAEYCYSQYENGMGNYRLYVYIYNPALLDLSESVGLNKIQLAVSFNYSGVADKYSKFQIEYCNKSGGDYYKLFYKYKVIDTGGEILNAVEKYAKANNGIRRYHISGIEILSIGDYGAVDYKVATTYEYSGFAEGYGSTDFPLTYKSYSLETLELKVHSTYYRPKGENVSGTHVQDQLNSVYFAVPNDTIKRYGTMQAVHVEWYEYLTKEVFMIGNKTVYDKLKNYIGQTVTAYDDSIYYGLAVNRKNVGPNEQYPWAEIQYNLPGFTTVLDAKVINTLYYLFSTGGTSARDYRLSSAEFQEWIRNYSDRLGSKTINGKYSDALFYKAADDGRTAGYNEMTIKADDGYSLTSYILNKQAWWEKLFGIKNYTKTAYDGIKGIYEVSDADFVSGNKSVICEKLYISEGDYDHFKAYYDTVKSENKTVFLLRFAVTDYVSKPTQSIYGKYTFGVPFPHVVDENNYMGQQTVFLDFDIIDVTFFKDGVNTVIPVVSSPIDIINDFTPPVNWPEDETPWWVWLVLALVLLIVLIVLSIVVKPVAVIISVVFKILLLPFKLLWKLLRAIFKKRGNGSG